MLAFGGGLAIAVYTMLHGVEKKRGDKISRPAAHLNLPALAALMVVFGAVGYLLVRNSALGSGTIGMISAAAGAAGWFGMTVLMAKWALRPNEGSAHDEAEEMQGQLARVLTPIRANALGSVRYEKNGRQHDAPARGLDDREIPVDTDVVIDRFDGGVAVVEDWASVEQRL